MPVLKIPAKILSAKTMVYVEMVYANVPLATKALFVLLKCTKNLLEHGMDHCVAMD
jgi:hypothetical protein